MPSKRPLSSGGSCAHSFRVLAGRHKFLCLLQSQVLCLTDSEHSKHSRLLQTCTFLLCPRCEAGGGKLSLTSSWFPPWPLLTVHGKATRPVRGFISGSPLPSRLTPGASLLERIQAIAQNVSDIAVKVDQILRHSLILHSKGASQPGHCPVSPEASALLDRAEPLGSPISLVMLA